MGSITHHRAGKGQTSTPQGQSSYVITHPDLTLGTPSSALSSASFVMSSIITRQMCSPEFFVSLLQMNGQMAGGGGAGF